MAMNEPTQNLLRSFGRTRGRRLHKSRSAILETLLPKLLIALHDEAPATCNLQPATLFSTHSCPLWFEIGFGGGEHLVEQARRHPEINFIGCEPYINGMASLLVAIDKDKLTNIRLYDGDARELLEKLPDNSIERLFILFPDPWPKARHHKRRIINKNSLKLFYRVLQPGGLLRLATDHEDYGAWMLENLLAFGKFRWTATSSNDWKNPPADWAATRYQAKAEAEGRKPLFLDWKK
jgi:tRNA (guanine-N7-)-methyltransferase